VSHLDRGGQRREVLTMALLMEGKLRENDHKTGWKAEDPAWLLERLQEEVDELGDAMREAAARPDSAAAKRDVGREAADVANFAMMIADRLGGLG
jgi:NTP pyrophosphatase (non-canonical NTP hydrolase)